MREFGPDVLLWSACYVVLLLVIGAAGRRARREATLSDHFLAGRSIGFGVLLITLFATQYSGNSLSGFPGQTYRAGLSYFMSVTFMVAVVSGYTLFAPRLFRLSREFHYVTPTDFLDHRFGHPWLHYASAAILVITLGNFLLAQLMALGHAFSGLTDGRIPYVAGVLGGALVILVYEVMGGMRAVAWTDALQGIILAAGLCVVLALILIEVGTPAAIVGTVAAAAPEKVANPDARTCAVWFSNFLLLGLGGPLYPQAIQRIYAARSLDSLRRSLAVMSFLPLFAVTTVVFIGLAGLALFPGLDRIASDRVTFLVLTELVQRNELAYYPVLLVMLAVVAAIMSTADSCLLSITSIFAKDFVARARRLGPAEAERFVRFAPLISVMVIGALCLLAMRPLTTLWGLLVIKFEILIQLSPAFVLGALHDRDHPRAFTARDVLLGLAAGLTVTLALYASGAKPGGFHPGAIGVAVNYAAVLLRRWLRLRG